MKELRLKDVKKRISAAELPGFDLVVGIAEGGTAPAALIAEKLGCPLRMVRISYRDEEHIPIYPEPVVRKTADIPAGVEHILVVDDVAVSGKTMKTAVKLFTGRHVETLVLKGRADHVLFPEIEGCVKWPWKNPEENE